MADGYGGQSYKAWQSGFDTLSGPQKELLNRYSLAQGWAEGDPKGVLQAYADVAAGGKTWDEIKNVAAGGKTGAEQEKANIEDYITQQKTLGEQNLAKTKAERASRRTALASQLAGMRERAFKENTPGIQEGLSAQGLLHSSALGTELAKEQGRLQTRSEDIMNTQELSDLDYEQMLQSGILGEELGTRTAAMNRDFSLADWSRNAALAKQIAEMQGNASDRASKNALYGDIFGGLTQLSSGFLAGRK